MDQSHILAIPKSQGQRFESDGAFSLFVWKNVANRSYLTLAVGSMIVQFTIFKLLYPFPDFFSDSYSYIYAASANLDVNIWPIGYSKFLGWFHSITHSHVALIALQYFTLELTALLLFFTILFFYSPGKLTRNILFIFLFLNPLFLYIANYVNSDPIFATLSLLWFTQLIWILYRPSWYQVFAQAILVFCCFTVRNNAYYYPFITILVFTLSRQRIAFKVAGITLPFAFLIPFVLHTREAAYKITGTRQFSLFTGWQLANNALYMYDRIDVDSTQWRSAETKELDRLSRQFVQSIPPKFQYRAYLNMYVGNYFIRQPEAPLKQYLFQHYEVDDDMGQVLAWGRSSVVFADFGEKIIKRHPIAFLRYFVLGNVKNYFLPPLEKLDVYNLGMDDVSAVAQDWFDLKTSSVWSASRSIQSRILFIQPPLFAVLNLAFFVCLAWYFIKINARKMPPLLTKGIILIGSFLILNFIFSIVATINVFRYQFVPMILCTIALLLITDWLDIKKTKGSVKFGDIPGSKNNIQFAK